MPDPLTPEGRPRAVRDRLDERERTARGVPDGFRDWTWSEEHGRDIADEGWSYVAVRPEGRPRVEVTDRECADGIAVTCIQGVNLSDEPQAVAEFIAAHDPATVLREVAAGRAMADEWERSDPPARGECSCLGCALFVVWSDALLARGREGGGDG